MKTMLVVETPDGGRLEHELPLVAGLDPLRWLAAAAKHIPMLRQDATAWCEPPESYDERQARLARLRRSGPPPGSAG